MFARSALHASFKSSASATRSSASSSSSSSSSLVLLYIAVGVVAPFALPLKSTLALAESPVSSNQIHQ